MGQKDMEGKNVGTRAREAEKTEKDFADIPSGSINIMLNTLVEVRA